MLDWWKTLEPRKKLRIGAGAAVAVLLVWMIFRLSIQDLANVVMATAAVAALWYAVVQVQSSREDTREATAKEIRSQYLLEAIRNPALANPVKEKLIFEEETYDGDKVKFYNYTWFVSFMLLQCDELLRLCGDTDDWKWEQIVENNIRYHEYYIKSPAFDETYRVLSLRLQRKLIEMGLRKSEA